MLLKKLKYTEKKKKVNGDITDDLENPSDESDEEKVGVGKLF